MNLTSLNEEWVEETLRFLWLEKTYFPAMMGSQSDEKEIFMFIKLNLQPS